MIESRFDATAPSSTSSNARQPFVAPRIEDMGGLKELTLVGASL